MAHQCSADCCFFWGNTLIYIYPISTIILKSRAKGRYFSLKFICFELWLSRYSCHYFSTIVAVVHTYYFYIRKLLKWKCRDSFSSLTLSLSLLGVLGKSFWKSFHSLSQKCLSSSPCCSFYTLHHTIIIMMPLLLRNLSYFCKDFLLCVLQWYDITVVSSSS